MVKVAEIVENFILIDYSVFFLLDSGKGYTKM